MRKIEEIGKELRGAIDEIRMVDTHEHLDTEEEFIARRGWSVSAHADDAAAVREQLERLLAGEAAVVDFRMVRKDGTVRWVRDYARPVRDEVTGTRQDRAKRVSSSAPSDRTTPPPVKMTGLLAVLTRSITLLSCLRLGS